MSLSCHPSFILHALPNLSTQPRLIKDILPCRREHHHHLLLLSSISPHSIKSHLFNTHFLIWWSDSYIHSFIYCTLLFLDIHSSTHFHFPPNCLLSVTINTSKPATKHAHTHTRQRLHHPSLEPPKHLCLAGLWTLDKTRLAIADTMAEEIMVAKETSTTSQERRKSDASDRDEVCSLVLGPATTIALVVPPEKKNLGLLHRMLMASIGRLQRRKRYPRPIP